MAKLPDIKMDQTLLDIDKALEEKQKLEEPRHYLGMSQIGNECWRSLFYSFRNAEKRFISASGLRAIKDGFDQEDLMIERLRMLDYIELHTVDPQHPTEQIGFEMLLGHFRGHCDGMIKGVKVAPQTWHTWENKAVNETKFNKLEKLKIEVGEKNALKEWDIIYYDQAIIYMHESKTKRHYLNVETPGGRQYTSCRTDYNKARAEGIITKAKVIIFDNDNIPERMSSKREFYKCKWCEFSGICHDGDIPLVHCKTCRYSEPVKNGERFCHYKEQIIDNKELHNDNCLFHVFNPALLPNVTQMENHEDGCTYKTDSGFIFSNVFRSGMPEARGIIDGIFTSQELYKKVKNIHSLKKGKIEVKKMPVKKAWD